MRNRNVIIGLIIFLSLLCVSLVAGMIILMNKDIGFNFGLAGKMRVIDTFSIHASKIDELDFNLYSADVEIKEIEDDEITIEYYSNKDADKIISLENGHIIVNEEKSRIICVGLCFDSRRAVAYVPKDYIGSYNIETTSGDVKSNIDTINNKMDIKTTSGDIRLQNAGTVNIKTTSGDIDIRGEVNELYANTTSGDIRISKVNNNMSIGTTSGYVSIDKLSIVDNSNISTISGDVKIDDNNSDCYVEFSTISGSNHIEKSNRKSDIVLKVNTISGDIRVN